MYAPYDFETLNKYESCYIPAAVKSRSNATYAFWERSLFQRALSTILWTVPEEWRGSRKDFLQYCVFRFGYVPVFYLSEFGYVFSPATLSGYDFYYQPTVARVANPALPESLELVIGQDCELIKLTPDYQGTYDIVSYYAEKLSTLDAAINVSIINSKFSWLIGAKNKAAAETLRKIFDKVNRGEPAVFFDSKLLNDSMTKEEPWQFLDRKDLKQSYLTPEMLTDFQTLLNMFDAEIGIPTVPYQKRERMVTSEAESRQIDSTSRSRVWFDTLSESIDVVNRRYGLNLVVELRHDPMPTIEEVVTDER